MPADLLTGITGRDFGLRTSRALNPTLLMQGTGSVTQSNKQLSGPSTPEAAMYDDETVRCWVCPHDVDDHDEHARCMSATCPCGW